MISTVLTPQDSAVHYKNVT